MEAGNELGKDRARSHLSEFSDWTLLREANRDALTAVALIPFITAVRDTLTTMFRECVDAGDAKTFETTSEALGALFAHYHPDWRADQWTRGETGEGKAAKQMSDFVDDHRAFTMRIFYNALSYVIERVGLELLDPSVAKRIVAELQKRLGDATELLNWAARSWSGEEYMRWEVLPRTRGVWIEDPSRRTAHVVVLRGLRLQQTVENSLRLGPSEFIKHKKDDLIAETRKVLQERDDWTWLLPGLLPEHAERLIAAFETSATDYDRSVEESIIAAGLSEERIEDFRQAVLKAYGDGSVVRQLLEDAGRVKSVLSPTLPRHGYLQRGHKEAYIDQHRVSYLGWGEQYGRGLQERETELFVGALRERAGSGRTVPRDTSIVDMLRLAAAVITAAPESRPLLLVHHQVGLRIELEKSEGFTPAWQLEGRRVRGLIGYLGDAAVVGSETVNEDEVLGVDIARACHLEEDDRLPSVEVRQLSGEEVKEIVERRQEDGKELAKQVLVRVGKGLQFVADDTAGIVVVRRSP